MTCNTCKFVKFGDKCRCPDAPVTDHVTGERECAELNPIGKCLCYKKSWWKSTWLACRAEVIMATIIFCLLVVFAFTVALIDQNQMRGEGMALQKAEQAQIKAEKASLSNTPAEIWTIEIDGKVYTAKKYITYRP